jgi:hypothetical protein
MGDKYVFPDQDILAGPGKIGNCMQACVAGILGKQLHSVPHFALLGMVHATICLVAWLDVEHNLYLSHLPDQYEKEGLKPLGLCIATGFTSRGNDIQHACIADTKTGEVIHDPHPSKAGLIKPLAYLYFFPKKRS